MEVERWEKVKEVLCEALEQPVEARQAFLDGVCGAEDWLREEVESLLEPEDDVVDFIEQSPVPRLPPAAEDGLPEQRRLGHYEIVELLGRGGMGVVYLAKRADQEFEQKVAVKVVKRGMDTDEIVSRFRHERRILAQLDHPHIARLFDGGTTSDGLPYFVMEYVEGKSIREYCALNELTVNERLRLFLDVCDAVQFAHQSLVVHRDLKPANILVTEDGTVKLLDFGVARLLGEDGPSEYTRLAGRRFTPEYASPEQFRGQQVTTASDVYSLGVLLFELLTGQRPFAEETTGDFLIRATKHQDPDKPSIALKRTPTTSGRDKETLGKLRRRLSGDLDHIVLKALRSDPHERYGSARALAEDIQRHLTGYPVAARQGAGLYVVNRFIRRNWRALSVTVASVVALVVLGGMAFQQAAVRQQAQRYFDRSEAVQELLESIFEGAHPGNVGDSPPTLREVLDISTEAVRGKEELDPADRAELLNALGLIYVNLDEWSGAESLFRECLSLRRETFGRNHPLVGECLNNVGLALRSQNEYAEAEVFFRRAIDIGRRFDTDSERLPRYINNMAGLIKVSDGNRAKVIDLYEESLALMRAHYGKDAVNDDIARILNNLGNAWLNLGEDERAEPYLLQALDAREKLGYSAYRANTLHSLGSIYRDRGDFDKAEEYLTRSLELFQNTYEGQDDHSRIAPVLRSMGVWMQLQGRLEEAEQYHIQALEIQRHAWPGGSQKTAMTLRELAQVSIAKGDAAGAEQYAREALEMLEHTVGESHWYLADVRSVLGGALLAQGRLDEAAGLLEQAHADLIGEVGPKKRQTREAKERLDALKVAREGLRKPAG